MQKAASSGDRQPGLAFPGQRPMRGPGIMPNEVHDSEVLWFGLSSNFSNAVSLGFPVPRGRFCDPHSTGEEGKAQRD